MGRRKRKLLEADAKKAPPKKRYKVAVDFAHSLHALLSTEALSLSKLLRSSSKQQISLRFEKHLANSARGQKQKEDSSLLDLVHQAAVFLAEEDVETIPNFERCEVVSLQTVILLFCLQIIEAYPVNSHLSERAFRILWHMTAVEVDGCDEEEEMYDGLQMIKDLKPPPKIKEADGSCYAFPTWCDNDGFDSDFQILASARRRLLGMNGAERLLKHVVQILQETTDEDWALDDRALKGNILKCRRICISVAFILIEAQNRGKQISYEDFYKENANEIIGCCVTIMNLICEVYTMINVMILVQCEDSCADDYLVHIQELGLALQKLVHELLECIENVDVNELIQILFPGTLQFRILDNLNTDCIFDLIRGMTKNSLFTNVNSNLDMEHVINCRKSNKSISSDQLNTRFSKAACQFLLNKDLFAMGFEMCQRMQRWCGDKSEDGGAEQAELTYTLPKYSSNGTVTQPSFIDFEDKISWTVADVASLYFGKRGAMWKNMIQIRGLYRMKTLKQNTTPTARKKTRSGTKAMNSTLQIRGTYLTKLRDADLIDGAKNTLKLILNLTSSISASHFVETMDRVAQEVGKDEVLIGGSISSIILLLNPFENVQTFTEPFIKCLVELIRLRPDKSKIFDKILRGCLSKSGNTISLQTPPCLLQFLSELVQHMPPNSVTKMLEALWKSRPLLEKFNDTHIRFWTHVCSISDAKNASAIVKNLLALFEESMDTSLVSGRISLGLLLNVLSSEKPSDASCDLLSSKKLPIPGIPKIDPASKVFRSAVKLLRKRQNSLMEHLRAVDAEIKKNDKPSLSEHTLMCQLCYVIAMLDSSKSKWKGNDPAHNSLLPLFHALRNPSNDTYSQVTEILKKCLEAYKSKFDDGNGCSSWWVNISVVLSCHALFQQIINAFPNRDSMPERTHDHALLVSTVMDLIEAYVDSFVVRFNSLPRMTSTRSRAKISAHLQTVHSLVDQWDPSAKHLDIMAEMKNIELDGLKANDVIYTVLSSHLEEFPKFTFPPKKKTSKSSKGKHQFSFLMMEKISLDALLKLTMALIHFDKEGFVEEDLSLNNRFSSVIGNMAGNNYFKFIENEPYKILRLVEEYYDCTDTRLQTKFYKMKHNFEILSLVRNLSKSTVNSPHYRLPKDATDTISSNVPNVCDSLINGLTKEICSSLFSSVLKIKDITKALFTNIRFLSKVKEQASMHIPLMKHFQLMTKILAVCEESDQKKIIDFYNTKTKDDADRLMRCLELPYTDVADFFFAVFTKPHAQKGKFVKKLMHVTSENISTLLNRKSTALMSIIFDVYLLLAVASGGGKLFYRTIRKELFDGDFTSQPPEVIAKMFQLFRIINACVASSNPDSLQMKQFEMASNAKPQNVCTEVNRANKSLTMYFCQKCNMNVCHICVLRCHNGHTIGRSRIADVDECQCGHSASSSEARLLGIASLVNRCGCNAQGEQPGLALKRTTPSFQPTVKKYVSTMISRKLIKKTFQSNGELDELETLVESILDTCNKKQHGVVVRQDQCLTLTHKVEQVFKLRQSSASLAAKIDGSAFDFQYPPALLDPDAYGVSPALNVVDLLNDGCIALADKTFMRVLKMKSLLNPDHYQTQRRNRTSVQLLIRTEFTFVVHGIRKNSLNENYVAVYGHHHCQVVVLQTSFTKPAKPKRGARLSSDETNDGKNMSLHVQNRISLELGLEEIEADEDGSYYLILSVEWLPNSQTKLAITTNHDIRIFDLTKTNLSPEITLMLPNNVCIASSTFVYNSKEDSLSMFVLSQTGAKLYLIGNLHKLRGHVTLDKMLTIHNKKEVIGLCVYYSNLTNRLIVSTTRKHSFLVTLDPTTTKALNTEVFPQDPHTGRIIKENFCRWVDITPTTSGAVPLVGQIAIGNRNVVPSKKIIVVYFDDKGSLISAYQPSQNQSDSHISSFPRVSTRMMAIIDASAVNNSPGNFLTLQSDGAVTIHGPTCKSPQDVKVSWDPIKSWLQGFEASKSNTDPTVLEHATKVPIDRQMTRLSFSGDFEGSNRQAGRMLDPEERSNFMKSTHLHRLRLNISMHDKALRIVCVRVKIDRLVQNSQLAPTTVRLNGQSVVQVKQGINWYDLFVPFEDAASKITLTCEKSKHSAKNASYGRARVGGGYFSLLNDSATTDTKGIGIEGIEVYTMSLSQIKEHFRRVQEWTTPRGISKDMFKYCILNCIRNLAKRDMKKTEDMVAGVLSEALLKPREKIQFNTSSGVYEVQYKCGITDRFNIKAEATKALLDDENETRISLSSDFNGDNLHYTSWSSAKVAEWISSLHALKTYAIKFEKAGITGNMLDGFKYADIGMSQHMFVVWDHHFAHLKKKYETLSLPASIMYEHPLNGLPKSEVLQGIENLFVQRPQTTNSFGLYYEDDMAQLQDVLKKLQEMADEKRQLSGNQLLFVFQTVEQIAIHRQKHLVDFPQSRDLHFFLCGLLTRVFRDRIAALVSLPIAYLTIQILFKCLIPYCHKDSTMIPDVFLCVSFALLCPFKQVSISVSMHFCEQLISDGFAKKHWALSTPKQTYAPALSKLRKHVKKTKPRELSALERLKSPAAIKMSATEKTDPESRTHSRGLGSHYSSIHDRLLNERFESRSMASWRCDVCSQTITGARFRCADYSCSAGTKPGDGFDTCQECWENINENPDDFKSSNHLLSHFVLQMPARKPSENLGNASAMMRKHFAPREMTGLDREKLIAMVHKKTLNLCKNTSSANNDRTNDKLQQILFNAAVHCFTPESEREGEKSMKANDGNVEIANDGDVEMEDTEAKKSVQVVMSTENAESSKAPPSNKAKAKKPVVKPDEMEVEEKEELEEKEMEDEKEMDEDDADDEDSCPEGGAADSSDVDIGEEEELPALAENEANSEEAARETADPEEEEEIESEEDEEEEEEEPMDMKFTNPDMIQECFHLLSKSTGISLLPYLKVLFCIVITGNNPFDVVQIFRAILSLLNTELEKLEKTKLESNQSLLNALEMFQKITILAACLGEMIRALKRKQHFVFMQQVIVGSRHNNEKLVEMLFNQVVASLQLIEKRAATYVHQNPLLEEQQQFMNLTEFFFPNNTWEKRDSSSPIDWCRMMVACISSLLYFLVKNDKQSINLVPEGFQGVLCQILVSKEDYGGTIYRRQIKKLLSVVCGNDKSRHELFDNFVYDGIFKEFHQVCEIEGLSMSKDYSNILRRQRTKLSFPRLLQLSDLLTRMEEPCLKRPGLWIKYLSERTSEMIFLYSLTFTIPELATQIIGLLGKPGASVFRNFSGAGSETSSELSDTASTHMFLPSLKSVEAFLNSGMLDPFVCNFLLGSRLSKVRQACLECLLVQWACIFGCVVNKESDAEVETAKQLALKLFHTLNKWINHAPRYGSQVDYFLDLLVTILVDSSQSVTLLPPEVIAKTMQTLLTSTWTQHDLLQKHPCGYLYSRLFSDIIPSEDSKPQTYYLSTIGCSICHNGPTEDSDVQTKEISNFVAEKKFTHNSKIFTFPEQYWIQGMSIKISPRNRELAKISSKPVKTILLYLTSECKEISALKEHDWTLAKTIQIPMNATEASVEFSVPVKAKAMRIEFAAFHHCQSDLDMIMCPRCHGRSAQNGYCTNCGEHVLQCRTCRNINYEHPDAFICNSCGYCRSTVFRFVLKARKCLEISAIENEKERENVVEKIKEWTNDVDKILSNMENHRCYMKQFLKDYDDGEFSGTTASSSNSSREPERLVFRDGRDAGTVQVNNAADGAADPRKKIRNYYETDCKGEYNTLCNTYQRLHSAKEQLALYLGTQNPSNFKHSDEILNHTPFNEPCYSCMQSWINKMMDCCEELCHSSVIRNHIIERKVMEELLHRATNYVDATSRKKTCQMLCTIANADETASQLVLELINKQIRLCITHVIDLQPSYRTGPCSVPELVSPIRRLMALVASMFEDANEMVKDKIWEQRIRFAFALLFYAAQHGSKCNVIVQEVIHPCLKVLPHYESSSIVAPPIVLQSPSQPKSPASVKGREKRSKEPSRTRPGQARTSTGSARLSPMMKARSSETPTPLNEMKSLKLPPSLHDVQDPTKYGQWLGNLCFEEWDTSGSSDSERSSPQATWIHSCLLNPLSQDVRDETAVLLTFLMKLEDARVELLLDILLDTLRDDDIHMNQGENASEFFELLTTQMAESEPIRKYLLSHSILDRIITMITREVDTLNAKETRGRSLLINMSAIGPKPVNPTVLLGLCKLLRSCLATSTNMLKDNATHVQHLVEAFLRTQELVLQKTKVSVECADILRHVVEDVFGGSVADQKQMILVYMAALKKFLEEGEMRIPIFILAHICDIIQPTKQESPWSIDFIKDPKCEEFIRGSMKHRSYAAKDFNGTTMKAVQAKIAQELGTVGETGDLLELLVNNRIIDTNLPIADVVEKVWRVAQAEDDLADRMPDETQLTPMQVVYRIGGLNGEATEDIVNELPPDDDNDKNPEEVFSICNVMRDSNCLSSLIEPLKTIKSLDNTVTLNFATLLVKTLTFCAKLFKNRLHLMQINAVSSFLHFIGVAAKAEQSDKLMTDLLHLISSTLTSYDDYIDDYVKATIAEEGMKAKKDIASEISTRDVMEIEVEIPDQQKPQEPKVVDEKELLLKIAKSQAIAVENFETLRLNELNTFLELLVDQIKRKADPQRIELMVGLLPYLTYRQKKLNQHVLNFFEPHIDWDGLENTGEEPLLLVWFVKLCEDLKMSGGCDEFRNQCLNMTTVVTATYITTHLAGVKKMKKAARIQLANSKKALPLVLRCLSGLIRGHRRCQRLMRKLNVIKPVHALEKDSTSTQIGPLCERLLEAIGLDNAELKAYIQTLREKVRDKKKRKAMKRRQKMLDEMQVRKVPKLHKDADASSSSHVRLVSRVKLDGADDIVEESSTLKCMVCREGYTCQPGRMLGIYVYNKTVDGRRSSLISSEAGRIEDAMTDDFSVSTVSHFHLIHFDCHENAKRADANMKPPRKEWEGAQLRNSRTLCNNIFPIANVNANNANVSMAFRDAAEKYWDHIILDLLQVERLHCSKFEIQLDDLRMLLKRFSHKASFSEDCHGGGAVSNMQFVPYMAQLMCYLFDNMETVIKKRMFLLFEERNSSELFDLSKTTTNYTVETLLDTIESSLCLCLFFVSPERWKQIKFKKLQQLLRAAWRSHLADDDELLEEQRKQTKEFIKVEMFGYRHLFPLTDPLTEENASECYGRLLDYILTKSELAVQIMYIKNDGEIVKITSAAQFFESYQKYGQDLVIRITTDPNGMALLKPWWNFYNLIDQLHAVFHQTKGKKKKLKESNYNGIFEIVRQTLFQRHEEVNIELSEDFLQRYRAITSDDSELNPYEYLEISKLDSSIEEKHWIRKCLGLQDEYPPTISDEELFNLQAEDMME